LQTEFVKRRLNLLLVSDVSFSNVVGGSERVLFEQASRLAERGHNVHILTRLLNTHLEIVDQKYDVHEWRYFVGSADRPVRFILNTIKNGRQLFEKLQTKYRFDCINSHQPFSALSLFGSPYSRNISQIYTCHSLSIEEFTSRHEAPIGLPGRAIYQLQCCIRKTIEKKVINRSAEIVTLSRFTAKRLQRQFGINNIKMSIIPGGVDLRNFKPAENKENIRKKVEVPRNKIILLTVRNLVQRMGLENLILAMKEIASKEKNIYLVVGGDGPLKNELTALRNRLGLHKMIKFTGFIKEKELPNFYQMADFFILPTKELEGFGLVTLESLACGVPVLGTAVGGTKEILTKLNHNFLFEKTDPGAMADLIFTYCQQLKRNPGKSIDWRRQCRNFAENNYSWDTNIDHLENVFFRNARQL
jgi:glycosyltransferase involved in cell wall biosynthesis